MGKAPVVYERGTGHPRVGLREFRRNSTLGLDTCPFQVAEKRGRGGDGPEQPMIETSRLQQLPF
jgi:hypothetical protein